MSLTIAVAVERVVVVAENDRRGEGIDKVYNFIVDEDNNSLIAIYLKF